MNKPCSIQLLAFLCFLFLRTDAIAQAPPQQRQREAPAPSSAQITLDRIDPQVPSDTVIADPSKTIILTAKGHYSNNTEQDLDAGLLEWTSSSPNVLYFVSTGPIAIAKHAGNVIVHVTDVATHRLGTDLTVHVMAPAAAEIVRIELPLAITVIRGVPQQLVPIGKTDESVEVSHKSVQLPLTADQIDSWTSTDANNSTDTNVLVDKKSGVVTGLKPGSEPAIVKVTSTIKPKGSTTPLTATTLVTVVDPPAVQPRIGSKLIAGSKTVTILANGGDTISIYQFDPGFNPGTQCDADLSKATTLSIVNSPTTNKPTISLPISDPPDPPYTPQIITVAQPLIAGSALCILDRPVSSPSSVAWSSLQFVPDPDDYGRARTYFIAGVQVSNQQAASASSTAGQYLEAGLNYSWIRAKDHSDYFHPSHFGRKPGLSTNLDIRLSPIPVASQVTTVTTPPDTTKTTTTTSLNQLTTQQSARVVGSVYFPIKATHWNKRSDYFTFAPLLRGGFATLLNPTVGSGMAATTGASSSTLTTTTGNFTSAYSFVGYGARLGWDRYPASTDEAPQPIAQFIVTLGSYSNLPSYECMASTTQAMPNLTGSACGLPGSPFANSPFASRTLVPRLDIDSFLKLPNYPYVLGLDANLAQYSVFNRSNIDYLSKPGNDIRIYVGFKLDIGTIVSKLGINSQ